ncbi:phenylpropionate dioxygenase-like ring-hydroxylating dioxygenase large terminal subunit [Jatrophihabitans sp. GAS493]|uniref:aromatic ring-hydroxylating oxygenase subunit alpha n=1 Tax=Jatrophihabitans sp. GAS493 TaxID=1907575 RepID=UPI000BC0A8D8|nr:Rieske 2Fe-2S domain-containing protein [Jatrophihabitans sp. GAS493]SOD72167.1 phenylpropionate dioxygenase-like ring-hydroxylating dioxygenase large terminal subunit [Jatrophihabitans sp. GAS493]
MKDWPYEVFPTGWYQIGFSAELAPGDVRAVKYFDQDLVLFRTEDGEVSLLDAYCQHLGAHLGHGGKVKGDCIECPFHAWQWKADGSLHDIPYAPKAKRKVGLERLHTREVQGLLLAWYDGYGRAPFWEWPGIPEFGDQVNNYPIYPYGADHVGIRKIVVQSPIENTPDYFHFPVVHGAGQPGRPLLWAEDEHYLRTRMGYWFGYGKEATWLTPNGPVDGETETEAWGLGLSLARFHIDDFITNQLTATTPVDQEHSQIFCTMTVSREPGASLDDPPTGRAENMLRFQDAQIRRDFAIWENQRYIEHPPFAGGEELYYSRFRRWSKQFYFDRPYSAGETIEGDLRKADEWVTPTYDHNPV